MRLVSLLIMERGAQVSRAAREYIVPLPAPLAARPAVSLSTLFIGRFHPIWDFPVSSLQFLTSRIHVTHVTLPGLFIRQDYGMG